MELRLEDVRGRRFGIPRSSFSFGFRQTPAGYPIPCVMTTSNVTMTCAVNSTLGEVIWRAQRTWQVGATSTCVGSCARRQWTRKFVISAAL